MDDMNREIDNYEPDEKIVTPDEIEMPVENGYSGSGENGPEHEAVDTNSPDKTAGEAPVDESVTSSGSEGTAGGYDSAGETGDYERVDYTEAGGQPETVAEEVQPGVQPDENINYSAGRRYTYDPNGTEDETSYFDQTNVGGAGYGQQQSSSGYGAYNGNTSDGTNGEYASYNAYGSGNSGRTGYNGGYGQNSGYDANDGYGRRNGYGQGSYGQDNSYGQGNAYDQSGSSNRGSGYGQGDRYGQYGNSGQGNSHGQYGNSGQGNSYGQYGNSVQGNGYGQYGNSGQNGSSGQSGNSGQYGNSGQGNYSGNQKSGGTGNDNRYTNNGYGKGRSGYSSSYDSYRFETPVDPAPINTGETQYGNKKKKTQKNGSNDKSTAKKVGLIACIAALFGLIAALVFMGVTSLGGKKISDTQESRGGDVIAAPTPSLALGEPETAPNPGSASTGTSDTNIETVELTVPQVVEQCMPSMVAITNTTIEEYRDFFGGRSQQESVSAGSGIIVGETETELLIATNNHVIQNSTDITVTFIDNAAITGTIKGMDADNDLAIIAVKLDDVAQETKDAIRIITIGNSDEMVVGESVVAIGNALGYGQSVSAGIISALNREVDIDGQKHSLIQTDASINPGNSGGALINMRGELIGINEVKFVDETVEGVGYAIPMATAEPILSSLGSKAARQKVSDDEASYIGIKCLDVPSYYVQAGYPAGVYVSEVTEGGPAAQAGIKEGDIITAIDGISVTSSAQLINYLQYYAAGETIDFSVSRLNKDNTAFDSSKISITLGSKKDAGIFDESGSDESAPEEKNAEDDSGNEASEEEGADDGTDEGTEERPEDGLDNGEFPFMPDVENR